MNEDANERMESSPIGLLLQEPSQDRVIVFSTETGLGGTLDEFRSWYADNGHDYRWIGFNSQGYDNHVIERVLVGVNDPVALYRLSGTLINDSSWRRNIQMSAGGELSIDPFAMNGGAKARVGSLKECACRLDAPSLRTLPYAPDRVLTHDEMCAVVEYNKVDLEVTALVAACQADTIAARIALAKEYRTRALLNVHDPKLAELVLAQQLFETGYPTYSQSWTLLRRQFAEAFEYRTSTIQEFVARIPETMRFEVLIEQKDDGPEKKIPLGEIADSIKVGDNTYKFGWGGLHSDDEPGIFVSDERFTLADMDFDSFYPALLVNHGLMPEHLPDAFLDEFDALRRKRLQAKSDGKTDLANGLKIAINSIFGKTKSPYSWLCDPTVTVRTTLLGQLTLLWIIDALANAEGVEVISANTDGITLKVRRDLVDSIKSQMNQAAASIDMTLSWAEYRLIARRDVNNYIAVPADGGTPKCKGSYGYNRKDLGKKAVNRIVVDAVQAFFIAGTPVDETIRACSNITEFLEYFKAPKGSSIVDDTGQDHGKITRWYIGTAGVKLSKRKLEDGKLTQLVAAGAVVVPDLPTAFPDDVDFDFYVAAADTLVKAITEPETKYSSTLPLTDLSKAQRDLLEANKRAPADPARCADLDLDRYHADWINVIRGNPHDTMKTLMCRLWISERGSLSRGDLVWVATQLDDEGRVPERDRIIDWIVAHLSPFPIPRTVPEHVAQALAWAKEKVKPNLRKRSLVHIDALDSNFVKGDALRSYEKTRDVYKLACSICSIVVKNHAEASEAQICEIIEEIDTFLARDDDAATEVAA